MLQAVSLRLTVHTNIFLIYIFRCVMKNILKWMNGDCFCNIFLYFYNGLWLVFFASERTDWKETWGKALHYCLRAEGKVKPASIIGCNEHHWSILVKPGRNGATFGKQTPDGDNRKCVEKWHSEGIPPKYN